MALLPIVHRLVRESTVVKIFKKHSRIWNHRHLIQAPSIATRTTFSFIIFEATRWAWVLHVLLARLSVLAWMVPKSGPLQVAVVSLWAVLHKESCQCRESQTTHFFNTSGQQFCMGSRNSPDLRGSLRWRVSLVVIPLNWTPQSFCNT